MPDPLSRWNETAGSTLGRVALGLAAVRLEGLDLRQSPGVAAPFEGRLQPGLEHLVLELLPDGARRQ